MDNSFLFRRCYPVVVDCIFYFFKQKTAYEIPKRDWSSDVCSPISFDFLAPPRTHLKQIIRARKFGEHVRHITGYRRIVDTQLPKALADRIEKKVPQRVVGGFFIHTVGMIPKLFLVGKIILRWKQWVREYNSVPGVRRVLWLLGERTGRARANRRVGISDVLREHALGIEERSVQRNR